MELGLVNKEIERIERKERRLAEQKAPYLFLRDLLQSGATSAPETTTSDVDNVRWMIGHLSVPFTVDTISQELKSTFFDPIQKPNLSAILSRMAREGEISVIEQGAGRRPSIYGKIPTPSP